MLKIKLNLNNKNISALQDKAALISVAQTDLSRSLAADMKADIKASLNIPVERKDGKTIHSLPGQPPRRQSGLLRDAIETDVSVSGGKVSLIAGDLHGKAPYALYMEYGSLSVAPRPYLMPALSKYGQLLSEGIKTLAEDL